jgi:hypothetical protein
MLELGGLELGRPSTVGIYWQKYNFHRAKIFVNLFQSRYVSTVTDETHESGSAK